MEGPQDSGGELYLTPIIAPITDTMLKCVHFHPPLATKTSLQLWLLQLLDIRTSSSLLQRREHLPHFSKPSKISSWLWENYTAYWANWN